MSINPHPHSQIPIQQPPPPGFLPRTRSASRTWTRSASRTWTRSASRTRLLGRGLAVFVAVAVLLATPGGSGLAAAGPGLVAAPSGVAGSTGGLGEAGEGAGLGQAGPGAGQRAVAGPRLLAKAAILADEATGQVLFERNADAGRAMASTTKVMTALLALERLDERRVVTIGSGPPRVGEESLRLRQGERLTVRQLLLGLLVKSANDAGVALAEAVDGSEAAFVRRMNRKAAALRLTATHYVTPYGLDRPGHQTSARDLAHLWEVAMRRADFRSLVATRGARIPGSPLSLRRFVTTNQLLGSYHWTVGGKTGYTNRAGRCLVASASRGGRRLVAVALGSTNAFADVRALFEYGFAGYVRARLAGRGQPVAQVSGRPAAYQADADADADALVRLDQLGQVRLTLAPGAAGGATGTAAGGPGDATAAWFTVAGRRLLRIRLVRLPGARPAPTPTTVLTAPTTVPTSTSTTIPTARPVPTPTTVLTAPATGPSSPTNLGGTSGATLTVGTTVQVRPVPPGAAPPVIDAFLRRASP
jgi:D-alanyl-D-alanine carboxypeptidase (penicillin-binding protein 5/6)